MSIKMNDDSRKSIKTLTLVREPIRVLRVRTSVRTGPSVAGSDSQHGSYIMPGSVPNQ